MVLQISCTWSNPKSFSYVFWLLIHLYFLIAVKTMSRSNKIIQSKLIDRSNIFRRKDVENIRVSWRKEISEQKVIFYVKSPHNFLNKKCVVISRKNENFCIIFQVVPTHYVWTNGEGYMWGTQSTHKSIEGRRKKKVRGGEMLRGKRTV